MYLFIFLSAEKLSKLLLLGHYFFYIMLVKIHLTNSYALQFSSKACLVRCNANIDCKPNQT